MTTGPLDLVTIQKRLSTTQGRDYWRSLEELAETDGFQEFLQREFPRQASEWLPHMSRRHFLGLMGASLALAGLTACGRQPSEKIVPYVNAPEYTAPGQPLFFATAMQIGGYAQGVLAQSMRNRPTKIEGNPDHPASLGATDAFTQASVLSLYDPDRASTVLQDGAESSWQAFTAALQAQFQAEGKLHILTETITSPTLVAQLQAVLAAYPNAVWHQYEPVNRDNVYAGAELAFGAVVEPVYRLDQADVIVCLDADLFGTAPGRVRYARDFADGRREGMPETRTRNRLYVVESAPTITGTAADHRLPLRSGEIEGFVRALANELGLTVSGGDTNDGAFPPEWISAVASDLQAHVGTGLVVAGDRQPPVVHALVHAINETLGNTGQTVLYTDPVVANPINQRDSLGELVTAMQAGEVETLLLLGGNPVYNAPVELDFATALEQVTWRAYLGPDGNETVARCHWQLAESHYLEAWGDGRAYDGTVTIQQPLIEPLYDSRSAYAVLDVLLGEDERSNFEIVQAYWEQQHADGNFDGDFDAFWQTALHDGVVADTAFPPRTVPLQVDTSTLPLTENANAPDALEINFRPDPSVWDGRFANNGWLQELPRPLTKLTWENAALINPLTAEALGLIQGDLVELAYQDRVLEAPVWLLPGHSVNAVTLHLGYGRTHAGRVGTGAGVNAYALRTADTPWFDVGLTLRKVGTGHPFASTQQHHSMEGRNLVRTGTVAQFEEDPDFVQAMDPHGEEISLYPEFEYDGDAWGMTIDLNACNGCNACVVACQAENNIPIVGKEEVANGREMHWIRIDQYFQGDLLNPETHQQPVTCMHCENAPCEVVCPVAATLHDHEGLNTMVYNRCIGTRYCSNNCPYKVRRFNFLSYSELNAEAETVKLQHNPNVTVRARGVMEKCTYCVQRISAARIEAKIEGRPIQDGEVVTACQASCPTQAITFGNINTPNSQVAQRKASPLNYGMLTELNTKPRTTYLAKLRNPNPQLEGENG